MLSLTRWNPFEELSFLNRDLDRAIGWAGHPDRNAWSWVPAAEVSSDTDGWTVKMALPGLDPKGVTVDLDDRVLTVSGERSTKTEKSEKHISELGYGRFTRSFTVPETVDTEKVAARFVNGMLEVTLPLTEATKPRRIQIAA